MNTEEILGIIAAAAASLFTVAFFIFYSRKTVSDITSKKKEYRIVIAGDVEQQGQVSALCLLSDINKNKLQVGNKYIDPSGYLPFVVDGNSMSKKGINSKDVVLVKELTGDERLNIGKDKVILFKINTINKTGDAEFKLRNFLGYVTSKEDSLKTILQNDNINSCDITEKEIKEKYNMAKEKYSEVTDFIYSSTFKVKEKRLSCSFHPLHNLIGQVEYSFPQRLLN